MCIEKSNFYYRNFVLDVMTLMLITWAKHHIMKLNFVVVEDILTLFIRIKRDFSFFGPLGAASSICIFRLASKRLIFVIV